MYLGLDLGTGSLKAVVIDAEGETQWAGSESYETDLTDDRAEIAPSLWWDACVDLLRRAPRPTLEQVEGVGFSGQMHGVVLLDAAGGVLRPAILWHDRRATEQVVEFQAIDAAHPGVLSNPLLPGMPGPVLSWLRRNEPEVWKRVALVLSPKDWLRQQFLDAPTSTTDHSDASATLLYDVRRSSWSVDVAQASGIPMRMLADLRASTAAAGKTGERVEEFGIRRRTPVAVGAGDAAAALLGLGIEQPGTVLLNVGTGAQALTIVEDPDPSYADAALHQYRTAGGDADWYVMASIVNAGLVLDWVRRTLEIEWDALYDLAQDALRYPDDPCFAPFLVGERDPRIGLTARAAWVGLSPEHDRTALGRSALLGVASYLAERTRSLIDIADSDTVVLSGGSVRNTGWVQLLTNLLGVDVHIVTDPDASARGAAITAARSIRRNLAPSTASRTAIPQQEHTDRVKEAMSSLALRLRSSACNES